MDENNQHNVLSQHRDPAALVRENDDLRSQLAKLQNNVVDGGFRGEMPRYQLNEACFLDDTWFPAGTVLEWGDAPNMTMVPLNDPAKRYMEAYIAEQTASAQSVAASRGRTFVGLTNDRGVLLDAALMDAKATASAPAPVIVMPTVRGDVPVMPHTVDAQAQRARRGRPPKAVAIDTAPAASQQSVVGRMVSKG